MAPSPPLVLVLLLLGHVLADLLLSGRAPLGAKAAGASGRAAMRQAALWTAVQAALVLPLFRVPAAWAAVALLGLAHLGLVWLTATLHAARPRPLLWWTLDQALHLALLLVAARALAPFDPALPAADARALARLAAFTALMLFNVEGGSILVASLLAGLRSTAPEDLSSRSGDVIAGAGAWIGRLERILILLAVWHAQWGAVGLVLTAKSIARFKELENREFSEIYLIGTMGSVLVAIGCGLVLARVM